MNLIFQSLGPWAYLAVTSSRKLLASKATNGLKKLASSQQKIQSDAEEINIIGMYD